MRWKSMCQIAGIKEAFVVSVRAVLQIFYRVPDGAPGYLAGFTSEEISRCFREVGKDEVESRPAVWQRFFTADGRAGFERTRRSGEASDSAQEVPRSGAPI